MFLNYTTLLKIGLRSMMKISLQFHSFSHLADTADRV